MTDVRLREWRPDDAPRVALALDDPLILRWSHLRELGPERWIAEQRRGVRGPSLRLAWRVGAERREPPRVERDRQGVRRTLAVHVLALR